MLRITLFSIINSLERCFISSYCFWYFVLNKEMLTGLVEMK